METKFKISIYWMLIGICMILHTQFSSMGLFLKAEFKTTLEGLNKTAAKTEKASIQINGKLVEWSVKTANANGNELETDGANAFNDAIKAAGFKDGEFTITYAAGNIEIKAAAAGKNKIKGFKVTGEANEANEGKFKLDAVAKGIGRNAGEVLKLQVGDTNDEFNKISVDVKEMSRMVQARTSLGPAVK